MSQNKLTYCFKVFILIAVIILLAITRNSRLNVLIVANANNKESNIPEFKIDFDLQSITIKEDEVYQITNFIPETNLVSLTNIDYSYKEESMSIYKDAGEYKIVIIFKNSYGNEIEKDTSLTIKKVTSNTTKKDTKTSSNNTSNKTTSTTKTKKDIKTQILDDNKKLGDQGRLYFSSLYSVALYKPNSNKDPQSIVDKKDSAAYFKFGNVMVIADHVNQGFSIIKSQKVGAYVYIKKKNSNGNYVLEKYKVIEKTTGTNKGTDLITKDNRSIAKDVNCSLVLYTCNSKKNEVTILLLNKV